MDLKLKIGVKFEHPLNRNRCEVIGQVDKLTLFDWCCYRPMRVRRPLIEETTPNDTKRKYIAGESIAYCPKCKTEKDITFYALFV